MEANKLPHVARRVGVLKGSRNPFRAAKILEMYRRSDAVVPRKARLEIMIVLPY